MSEEISNCTWHAYTEYVNSLEINEKLIQIETKTEYISSHAFYLNIFYLFAPAFTKLNKEVLSRLSMAGYIYFRSALLFDSIMDTSLNNQKLTEVLMLGLT